MSFLRHLSTRVYQKFTYFCSNSAAWYNLETYSYDKAITLMGDNDFEFKGSSFSRTEVFFDGCRVGVIVIGNLATVHGSNWSFKDFGHRNAI